MAIINHPKINGLHYSLSDNAFIFTKPKKLNQLVADKLVHDPEISERPSIHKDSYSANTIHKSNERWSIIIWILNWMICNNICGNDYEHSHKLPTVLVQDIHERHKISKRKIYEVWTEYINQRDNNVDIFSMLSKNHGKKMRRIENGDIFILIMYLDPGMMI